MAVAAGIVVPTMVINADSGGHSAQRASTPGGQMHQTAAPAGRIPDSVLTEKVIVNMIMNIAANRDDPTPSSIQYAYGTRTDLNQFIFKSTTGGAAGQVPSVLVQATGHFTWDHSAPKGLNPVSTGTAIYVIISQKTGNVTDQGIGPNPIDLTPLGQVFHPTVPSR